MTVLVKTQASFVLTGNAQSNNVDLVDGRPCTVAQNYKDPPGSCIVAVAPVSTAEKCNDSTFGLSFCSKWCNVKGYWGCGTSTLVGTDGRNTDNKDYTCSCNGCNGCDTATTALALLRVGGSSSCSTDGTWHLPLDMAGQQRTVATPARCQQRCRDTTGCRYFNNFPDGGCHITTGASGTKSGGGNPTVRSGSVQCIEASGGLSIDGVFMVPAKKTGTCMPRSAVTVCVCVCVCMRCTFTYYVANTVTLDV